MCFPTLKIASRMTTSFKQIIWNYINQLPLNSWGPQRPFWSPQPGDGAGRSLRGVMKNTLCSFRPTHSSSPACLLPNTGLSNHSVFSQRSRKSKSSQTNAEQLSRSGFNRCHRWGLREPERHDKQWAMLVSSICLPGCTGPHRSLNSSLPQRLLNWSLSDGITVQKKKKSI